MYKYFRWSYSFILIKRREDKRSLIVSIFDRFHFTYLQNIVRIHYETEMLRSNLEIVNENVFLSVIYWKQTEQLWFNFSKYGPFWGIIYSKMCGPIDCDRCEYQWDNYIHIHHSSYKYGLYSSRIFYDGLILNP